MSRLRLLALRLRLQALRVGLHRVVHGHLALRSVSSYFLK